MTNIDKKFTLYEKNTLHAFRIIISSIWKMFISNFLNCLFYSSTQVKKHHKRSIFEEYNLVTFWNMHTCAVKIRDKNIKLD
jgi:hypothetical protein